MKIKNPIFNYVVGYQINLRLMSSKCCVSRY